MKNFVPIPKQIIKMHLSGSEFLLYATLKSFCYGYKTTCYPKIDTLIEESGLSKSTINRASKVLEERGLIEVTNRYKPDGTFDSNLYRLLPLDETEDTEEDQEIEETEETQPEVNETEETETEQKNSSLTASETMKEQQSHTLTISNIDSIRENDSCQVNLESICNELGLNESESEIVKGLTSFSMLGCTHVILGGKGYSIQSIINKLASVTPDQMKQALNKLTRYQVSNKSAYLLSILLSQPEASSTAKAQTNKPNKAKSKNRFNNFEQRKYDFEELESRLANL